jgi:hypothetical protein
MRCRDILAKLIANIDARGLSIFACTMSTKEEMLANGMKQPMPPI